MEELPNRNLSHSIILLEIRSGIASSLKLLAMTIGHLFLSLRAQRFVAKR